MNWLFFALISQVVYTIVVFIDKLVLEKYIKNYLGMPLFSGVVALLFGTAFWIFSGFPTLALKDSLLVMSTGILLLFGTYFYFKALSKEESSMIIILFQLTPIIVLVMSWMFLKESITQKQLLGFILILIAAIGISIKKTNKRFKFSEGFVDVVMTDLLWGASYVLFKFVSDTNSFSKLISYESWGIALGGVILFTFFSDIREAFLQSLKKVKKSALNIIFLNEGIFILAKLLGYYAISLGPVALVTVIGSTQVFIGIFYGLLFTLFAPKLYKEDISKNILIKKSTFGLIAFTGIYLIS